MLDLIVLLSIIHLSVGQFSYSEGLAVKRLLQSRNIDPDTLPAPNRDMGPFPISAHFLMHGLVDVDAHQETMRLTASLVVQWVDFNLKWTREQANITWMSVAAREIWYPTLLLSNSVGERVYARPDPRFDQLTIHNDGAVILRMYYAFDTNCDADVLKFPRDTLTCKLAFVSSLGSEDLVINAGTSTSDVMIAFDNDDSEWRVQSVTFKSTSEILDVLNSSYNFSSVTAEITVIRAIGYYLVILQFPILIISCLIVLSTFIPIQDGERMSFIMELCLTYIVFLLLLDSILPRSGLPILSVCVIVCFFLAVVNMIEAIIVRKLLEVKYAEDSMAYELVNLQDKTKSDHEVIGNGTNANSFPKLSRPRVWRMEWILTCVNIGVVSILILMNICVVYS